VHAGLVAHGRDRAPQSRSDDLDADACIAELAQLLQLGG